MKTIVQNTIMILFVYANSIGYCQNDSIKNQYFSSWTHSIELGVTQFNEPIFMLGYDVTGDDYLLSVSHGISAVYSPKNTFGLSYAPSIGYAFIHLGLDFYGFYQGQETGLGLSPSIGMLFPLVYIEYQYNIYQTNNFDLLNKHALQVNLYFVFRRKIGSHKHAYKWRYRKYIKDRYNLFNWKGELIEDGLL